MTHFSALLRLFELKCIQDHDTQYNDALHNDTQHNDTQHSGTQHNQKT